MLEFNEDFFKAEEREGFYIESTMKRYWANCLEMVRIIDEICRRHNLTYYADWGTLLGAVRHNGFIPWDDDIDLCLKRPDYERLMRILPQEMPRGYVLSNSFINDAHRQFFSGFSNGSEINLSKDSLRLRYECPFVAVIDIFPLDYLPRDPNEEEVVRNLFIIIWTAVEAVKKEAEPQEIEEAVKSVEEYCGVRLDREKPLRSQLWKLANQLVMSYTEDEGDNLTEWCTYINSQQRYKFEKEWFEAVEYLPFENIMMPVPREYKKLLDKMYGDWMQRVKNSAGHEYPAFKKQLDFLKRKVNEMKTQVQGEVSNVDISE